jgi:hypothetical protein
MDPGETALKGLHSALLLPKKILRIFLGARIAVGMSRDISFLEIDPSISHAEITLGTIS